MKTQFFFPIAVMVALSTGNITAQKTERINHQIIRIEKGDKARTLELHLANLDQARTEISIIDATGKSWLSKYVWLEDGYHGLLNLSELPDGDYLLQVLNRQGHSARAFKLRGPSLTFFEPEGVGGQRRFASFAGAAGRLITNLEANGKTLAIRLANLKGQPVNIHMVSLGGIPIFSRTLKEQDGFSCGINLEGVAEGQYYLYIQCSDASIFQFAELDAAGVKLSGRVNVENPTGDGAVFTHR